MAETPFYRLLSLKEFGFIMARTVPLLGSVPWSCLSPWGRAASAQPPSPQTPKKPPGIASPNQQARGRGAGGGLGVGGFLFSPLMLLKTKAWNPFLPPSIQTAQKYRFAHDFTQVFHAPQNCIGSATAYSWRSCFFNAPGVSSKDVKLRKEANHPLQCNGDKS